MALTVLPTLAFGTGGSDTAASGAGPGTAVAGTAAAHTGGSSTTTIAFTNAPDLSGVAQDGSHVLWLKTASGRQYSRISTVDDSAKTCVVQNAFNIDSGSPVDYAIGGKRATFGHADSRNLFSTSMLPGWTITTDADQAISTALACSVAGDATTGLITIRGTTSSPRPKITQSSNAACLTLGQTGLRLQSLHLTNTNGTKTTAYGIEVAGGSADLVLVDCELGDATNALRHGIHRSAGSPAQVALVGTSIHHCTSDGINEVGGTSVFGFVLLNSRVHSNAGVGLRVSYPAAFVARSSLVHGNGQEGLLLALANMVSVTLDGNTIHGNGTSGTYDAVKLQTADSAGGATIVNNAITGNTGAGVTLPAGSDARVARLDHNDVWGNGSAYSGASAGANDLAVDPSYADAGAGDFTPGNAALAAAWPSGWIGAVQPAPSGGGGGGAIVIPGTTFGPIREL